MQLWLRREGYELEADDRGLVDAATAIANKRLSIEDVAEWIEQHSRPLGAEPDK